MSGRLPTHLAVGALLRRVNDAGGMAVVRGRGDAQGGGVLIVIEARDGSTRVIEHGYDLDGSAVLRDSTPSGPVDDYWRRRRTSDPDLWVIELDIADAERFAAETILND
ncbi:MULTISPECIES: DUF1491 family protein [unclassified Sphingomonas]|jgi:hypothetical protein|uniref:DUF1491 family protein n=1 Tax=unclassified Sphingomonas TaxID=196159 RepID=UPI000E1083EA|nr:MULTISPECIES: DUF1491 family protein [unclassified Sphingomonas]AXJ95260.1 DUF1491 domain-containing protein [Sphingomonas sp. FARSPH]